MTVALAKLVTPAQVGEFSLGFAVTAPLFLFTSLQLRSVQATDAQALYGFGDYLILRLVLSFVALVSLTLAVIFGTYTSTLAITVLAVAAAKSFESISDILYGLFQQRERLDIVARSMILRGGLSLLALVVVVYMTSSVPLGVLSMAAVWFAVLLIYDLPASTSFVVLRQALTSWHFSDIWRLVLTALPLGIVLMLGSITSNIPRYFLQGYLGEHELGLFSALAYFMVAGGTLVSAVGQSVTTHLSRAYAQGRKGAFWRLTFRLCIMGAFLGIAGVAVSWMAGPWILRTVYSPEYANHNDALIWLMAAAGFSYVSSFLGYAMTAARVFSLQVPLNVFFLALTAGLCALAIPRYGLIGAAVATCVATAGQLPVRIGILAAVLRPKRSQKTAA